MRDGAIFDIVAGLMQRKLRFLLIVVGAGLAGIVYAHGWSWTTAILSLVVVMVLGFGWALTSFWIWFFRNAGRQGDTR